MPKKPNLMWVKTRYSKEQLQGRTVIMLLNGAKVPAVLDVLGPNEDGLLQITARFRGQPDENTVIETPVKLNQKQADSIRLTRART